MAYVITEACVDVTDRACIKECPVDCIYEGDRMLYINAEECIDCGACEPTCPMGAIFYEDDVPLDLVQYTQLNKDFFIGMESPGGAAAVGRIGTDVDYVAALPTKDTSA
jgi:ferredoxin